MSGKIKVIVEFELSQKRLESLVLLYQPVFSFNALNLYLTLYEMGRAEVISDDKELVQILKSPSDELVTLRQELEQMNLLNTYRAEHDTYVLNEPLSSKEFLQHAMFGRLYSIVCGQESFKQMVLKHVKKEKQIEGKEITKRFDPNRLAIWDAKLEAAFAKQDASLKPKTPQVETPKEKTQEIEIQEASPRFDVELFFDGIPSIVYPLEFRSTQLKKLIEEVGTLYQVDFETMKRFMINSSNFETKRFDTRKFVFLLEKEYGRMKVDDKNPYDVDPVSFIRHKQGYDYVVGSDQNLVKSLTDNFGFTHKVVNVLVEYVLDVNDNNLNRAYVEKIASTWKRNGVETIEDAKAQIQPKESKKRSFTKINKKQAMPEYTEEQALSTEDEQNLRDSIQRLLKEDES